MELWVQVGEWYHYYFFIPPESERHASYVEGVSFNIFTDPKGSNAQVVSVSKGNFSGVFNAGLENHKYHKVSHEQLSFLVENDLIKEVLGRLEDL